MCIVILIISTSYRRRLCVYSSSFGQFGFIIRELRSTCINYFLDIHFGPKVFINA